MDIHEKWTHYDFQQVLDIFHEGIQFYPPPKHPFIWYFVLLFFWSIEGGLVYYVMTTFMNPSYIFILPTLLILTAFLFLWRYKSLRAKFEFFMFDMCDKFNATENIRGIHYHFKYERPAWYCFWHATRYFLTIQFDDRYQLLMDEKYQKSCNTFTVTIPDLAHIHEKPSYTSWEESSKNENGLISPV
ncbi:unnamed protein product [Cunninghamella echinulata]